MAIAQLLKTHHHLLLPEQGPVLDLVCVQGQNGLFLMEHNINTERLSQLNQQFAESENQC